MKNALALGALFSVASSGCYLGSSPGAKTGARVIDASLAMVGGAMLLSGGSSQCSDDSSGCVATVFSRGDVGGVMLGVGLLGLLINSAVPTQASDTKTSVPRR
ncbi:hypothetical protein BH11MYX2_BH11MYX2_35850 [soil metagenome]